MEPRTLKEELKFLIETERANNTSSLYTPFALRLLESIEDMQVAIDRAEANCDYSDLSYRGYAAEAGSEAYHMWGVYSDAWDYLFG
jgi:hypothetical protein